MPESARGHEQTFNQALGSALKSTHPQWQTPPGAKPVVQAEELGTLAKPHHRLRPDVLIMDRDFPSGDRGNII